MMKKNKILHQKFSTFHANVQKYPSTYPNLPQLQLPTLEEVKSMTVDDNFWNIGSLTHPNEPWAMDVNTQNGIRAYCIGLCKVVKKSFGGFLVKCARWNVGLLLLKINSNLCWSWVKCVCTSFFLHPNQSPLAPLLISSIDVAWANGCPNGVKPIRLVHRHGLISSQIWNSSQEVLKAAPSSLCSRYIRMWMVWHTNVPTLLQRTAKYSFESVESNSSSESCWREMAQRSAQVCGNIVHSQPVNAEPLHPLENIERGTICCKVIWICMMIGYMMKEALRE